MLRKVLPVCLGLSVVAFAAVHAETPPPAMTAAQAAAAFGACEAIQDIALSPDGKKVVFLAPAPGAGMLAMVADLATGTVAQVQYTDAKPLNLIECGWSANDRIVCSMYGITAATGQRLSFTRLVAFDADGKRPIPLGRRSRGEALRISQYDGDIIDWTSGEDGKVLMERDVVPEYSTGTRIAESGNGLAVERVDTRTGKSERIEPPMAASGYISDARGNVRMMVVRKADSETGSLRGETVYSYRLAGQHNWREFSRIGIDEAGLRPIAVDGTANVAYALKKTNGRDALYRVALDGTMKAELVFADPRVDVTGTVRIGRSGRVIGARYVTDRAQVEYFDPEYKKLSVSLSRAIPKLPLIRFSGASADEKILLLHASSDTDPGRYYVLDRTTHHMEELLPSRPQLGTAQLAEVKSITYPAADGTPIPAYLTLPPGSSGKGLPALVMPHGGPSSRDEWGFDWLAQFFAQRGYAVLQPEYRGSAGYGDDWAKTNAFKSWRLAIGDVVDAGKWLVSSGTAAPSKLAIFGWSYGGYAALQANVIAPDLFRAAVAVAPVTDFGMLKEESRGFTNFTLVSNEIGSGAIVSEGSPARHADQFRVPVLLFHGDQDMNVGIGESRAMDSALRGKGKQSQLIVYKGLDHQLADSAVRSDMLAKSDAFLRGAMGL